ncbi:MAG: FGGY-family carbohydrate kinase [Phycisphaerae bacterium]|nr:FGGY-family carbohydrate kinase [Phycisphaerae bacterium]
MDYLAGIDLGSTTLKAIVYDLAGNAVARASRPTERFNPYPDHPDWAIWKPEQIWGGVCEALKEATAQLDNPADIKGIAVCGMGMDGVPIDKDGNWLYPFISWHCPRTEPQHRWWMNHIGPEKQFAIGGNQIWVFNTALRLLWMKENEPEILARTHKWLLIEDFINFMLCGVCATDHSMASTTLLFDQRKRVWSDELIEASGIDRNLLCDPLPSGTPLGKVHAGAAAATGLAEGTPIILGGHDYCCGTLSVGAFEPGVVLDVTGTWEIVVCALDKPVLTPEVRHMGIPVHSHVASAKLWAIMASAVAADMLEWFRGEYGFEERQRASKENTDDWDLLMQRAQAAAPGANGVMFLPHMSGSHCPVVDHLSLGAFVGLRNIATKGDMLRAMIEGLDFQFLQIVNGIEKSLGVRPEKFVAIGGATKNAFWMQNKADIIGKPIEASEIDEPTPLGAAILAGIGAGLYKNVGDAFEKVRKPGKIYTPDASLTKKYRRLFETWEQLYPSLKEVNARLRSVSS